ncbi:hypothetical protein EUGRSUZ_E01003 [Eucalyptus grandis]|uniref:Uncharacterized protein n=2 Tax=Eucalyptus grandis TaxID=71139 RepID=A0ACC3KPC1_EUCGR|nr:hypothetical protein EUGRSUZ_E01003 [Eucalyptus grandis]
MPFVSRESQVHESDWGRYSSSTRRSRVGSNEYNVTPRRQVQKKSAFLRLQEPRVDRRIGDDERLHNFIHRDENGSGSLRGKGPLVFPDHGMKEKREGRSVELDVSFKSNSLVAKAVVAPTSSSTVPGKESTPRTKRLKSSAASNGGFTNTLINKPDKSMVNPTRPPEIASCTLTDSKPSKERVVAASNTGSKINNQPFSKGTSSSVGKSKVYQSFCPPVLDQDGRLPFRSGIMADSDGKVNETHSKMHIDSHKVGTSMSDGKEISLETGIASASDSGNIRGIESNNILANKSPTVKIEKKKKVMKKAVKRVRVVKKNKPHSEMMTSKHLHGNDDHIRIDSSGVTGFDKGANPSKEDTTCTAIQMFHNVGANDASDGVSDLLQSNDVKGTLQGFPLQECGSDPDILETPLPQDVGENCGASRPIHSAVVEDKKACHTNSDSSLGCLHTNSRFFENLPASPFKSTFETGIEKLSLMQENDVGRLSYMLGRDIPDSSTLEDMNIHGVSTGKTVPFGRKIPVSSSDKVLVRSQDPSAASGLRVLDGSYSNSYLNQVSALDMRKAGGYSSKFSGSSTGCNAYTSANLDENMTFKDSTILHDLRQSSSVDLPASLKIHDSKGNLSIAASPIKVKELTTYVIDSRQDGVSKLDMLSSNTAGTCRETVNISCCSPSDALDTCKNMPVEDFGLQIATASCVRCVDSGLPSGSRRHDVSHGNKSIDELSDAKDLNKKGIDADEYENPSTCKKRGTTPSHPVFSNLGMYQSNDAGLLADSHASCSEMQLTACDSFKKSGIEAATPPMNTPHDSNSSPSWKAKDVSLMKSADAVSSAANRSFDDTLQLRRSVFDSGLLGVRASSIRNKYSVSQLIMEENQKDNFPVKATSDHPDGVLNIEKNKGKKVGLHSVEAQVMGAGETADCRSLGTHVLTRESGSSSVVRKTDSDIHELEESPSVSTYVPSSADGDGIYNSNSNDEGVDSVLHPISDMSSPENISNYLIRQIPRWKLSIDEIPPGRLGVKDAQEKENVMVGGGSEISVLTLSAHSTKIDRISDHGMEIDCISPEKDVILSSEALKKTEYNLKKPEPYGMRNQPNRVMQRSFPARSSFGSKTSKVISANGATKSNTWHRPSNSSVSLSGKKPVSSILAGKRQLTVDAGELYIRKGNSLVRKSGVDTCQSQIHHVTSSAAHRINSSGEDDLKRSIGTGKINNLNHNVDLLKTGGMSAPLEKANTSLFPSVHNLPNHTAMSSDSCTILNSAGPSPDGYFGNRLDSVDCTSSSDQLNTSKDALKISKTREDQLCSANKLEGMKELPNESLTASALKRITYVKRKSNQLVATTKSSDLPSQIVHKTQVLSSDGYFKRNKNQLIRTSIGNLMKQMSALPEHSRNSEDQGTPAVSCGRILNRGLSSKVWTLWGSKLSKSYRHPLHHQKCYQKVLPQLFPWKRATYWRRYMQTTCGLADKSSSAIRRLMLVRKRDTVYVRSAHGLSLRKSKVLSVGGTSLKWSKSIERQSKKANEDATRAVVAAEREKKEQNGSFPVSSRTKSKFRSSRAGERIFRIGSFRYKMDASRRTLQRISDDESAYSSVSQAKDDTRKSYVPRRLVIGNDEYVRIGNGNQLIRDPKKRTRLLASEKVRWSLHTARLRLTKRRKYCQFFTRFGKCNKDDGKCPYIHDPSKIAVCTKFINGSCSNKDCKLTHEIIPERMPDCSYFLQGLCTNKSCPYRHVNVNQNYPTCEAFLRGYCPDGNECRNKHSYICPTFEATGRCQQGSKCKLHHPKGRSKGKKRKRSGEKSSLGRYFGSMTMRLSNKFTHLPDFSL